MTSARYVEQMDVDPGDRYVGGDNDVPMFRSTSLSSVHVHPDVRTTTGVGLRGAHSFTGALEELRHQSAPVAGCKATPLGCKMNVENSCVGVQCPCGCLGRVPAEKTFKTREIQTMKLFVRGHDILNHQGSLHMPDQIAPMWKKDCRTWLWKNEKFVLTKRSVQYSLISHCSSGVYSEKQYSL